MEEARMGKGGGSFQPHGMQVRIEVEASGEDELTAYLEGREKAPRQQQQPQGEELGDGAVTRTQTSNGVQTADKASRARGKADERREQEQEEQEQEEEEEDVPEELLARLSAVAACLIQQSWRKTRKLKKAPRACRDDTELAATWSGPHTSATASTASTAAKSAALLSGTTHPSTTRASTETTPRFASGHGISTGKGRSSTAHTIVGASATCAGMVPSTIKALQVALARSGLLSPLEAFAWLLGDGSAKNAVSVKVLASRCVSSGLLPSAPQT